MILEIRSQEDKNKSWTSSVVGVDGTAFNRDNKDLAVHLAKAAALNLILNGNAPIPNSITFIQTEQRYVAPPPPSEVVVESVVEPVPVSAEEVPAEPEPK